MVLGYFVFALLQAERVRACYPPAQFLRFDDGVLSVAQPIRNGMRGFFTCFAVMFASGLNLAGQTDQLASAIMVHAFAKSIARAV